MPAAADLAPTLFPRRLAEATAAFLALAEDVDAWRGDAAVAAGVPAITLPGARIEIWQTLPYGFYARPWMGTRDCVNQPPSPPSAKPWLGESAHELLDRHAAWDRMCAFEARRDGTHHQLAQRLAAMMPGWLRQCLAPELSIVAGAHTPLAAGTWQISCTQRSGEAQTLAEAAGRWARACAIAAADPFLSSQPDGVPEGWWWAADLGGSDNRFAQTGRDTPGLPLPDWDREGVDFPGPDDEAGAARVLLAWQAMRAALGCARAWDADAPRSLRRSNSLRPST